MKFADAAAFRLPFGKHYGKTIDTVAMTDSGLLYLDWLRGDIEATRGSRGNGGEVLDALRAYLDDHTIATDLAKLTRSRA